MDQHLQKLNANCPQCGNDVLGFKIPDGRFICPNCAHPAVVARWEREWEPIQKEINDKHRKKENERERAEKERRRLEQEHRERQHEESAMAQSEIESRRIAQREAEVLEKERMDFRVQNGGRYKFVVIEGKCGESYNVSDCERHANRMREQGYNLVQVYQTTTPGCSGTKSVLVMIFQVPIMA